MRMSTRRVVLLAVGIGVLVSVFTTNLIAESKVVKNPPEGSPYRALIDGFKLIKAGKFDDWASSWCSTAVLCRNPGAIGSLKRYNLRAQKRAVGHCLKEGGTALYVTRVEGDETKDTRLKIFLACKPGSSPRPYQLIKEGGWKFEKI